MKTNQDALNALDYIQHDWQQKDGTAVFDEQCEEIRKALTANAWRDIDEKTPRNTDILLSGHEFNKPENRRFVCQGLIETRGNALAYGFDGMEDCQFADKWQPLPEQPPC